MLVCPVVAAFKSMSNPQSRSLPELATACCVLGLGIGLVFGYMRMDPGGIDFRYACALATFSAIVGLVCGIGRWWLAFVVFGSQLAVYLKLFGNDPLFPLGVLVALVIVCVGWAAGSFVNLLFSWCLRKRRRRSTGSDPNGR